MSYRDLYLAVYEGIRDLGGNPKNWIIDGFLQYLDLLRDEFQITPGLRLNHFAAQITHETDGFHTITEYASGRAYEGREDLGNTENGDGPLFKGWGYIQLTGRDNQTAFAKSIGLSVDEFLDQRDDHPEWALQAAAWYWKNWNINPWADRDGIEKITRIINGGLNGLKSRQAYYHMYTKIFSDLL